MEMVLKKNKGFTLIEVALGLSLVSIIGLAIYTSFSLGIKLSRRSDQNTEMFSQMRWAVDAITRETENMVPYDFSKSYPDKKEFEGSSSSVTFIVPLADQLKVVRYYLKDPDATFITKTLLGRRHKRQPDRIDVLSQETDDWRVLVRVEQNLIDYMRNISPDKEDEEVICTHILRDGLRFQYGYQNEDENIDWEDTWQEKYIPSHIQFEIDFQLANQDQEKTTIKKRVLIPIGFLGENK
ncbi:MAG: prepilin-type N-terminal cleavage/methylation domain-containing protein [Candidatus Omnitrophica bacterium]|nr:prepilin-type N-terminal cleavage/methylation domain-containing protein [Candidatus Omnitrophota bacterium]